MADNEPHAVVRLLLKRMESHPEEFQSRSEPYYERWATHMEGLREYGSEADNAAITAKLRDIRLAEIHEHVMDELVNGPERRRKQEEAREYERQMLTQGKLAQQQHTAAQQAHQQAYQNQYANQLGQSLGQYSQAQAVGIVGKSPNSIWVDEYANIANTGTIVATQPETTLSTSTINAIKKALKL